MYILMGCVHANVQCVGGGCWNVWRVKYAGDEFFLHLVVRLERGGTSLVTFWYHILISDQWATRDGLDAWTTAVNNNERCCPLPIWNNFIDLFVAHRQTHDVKEQTKGSLDTFAAHGNTVEVSQCKKHAEFCKKSEKILKKKKKKIFFFLTNTQSISQRKFSNISISILNQHQASRRSSLQKTLTFTKPQYDFKSPTEVS